MSQRSQESAQEVSVIEAVLPGYLRPIDGVDCVRIGPSGDGGYVLPREALKRTDWLISLGLGADWRFEEEFRSRSGAPVTAYDHTVTTKFWARRTVGRMLRPLRRRRIVDDLRHNPSGTYLRYRRFFRGGECEHRRVEVGDGARGTVSAEEILADCPGSAIWVKMDIEGAEWKTLAHWVAGSHRLAGMVVEFHDVARHADELRRFVAELPDFAVVNTSVNNVGGVMPDATPVLVELTLVRADLITSDPARPRRDLNAPNSSLHPTIDLRFRDVVR